VSGFGGGVAGLVGEVDGLAVKVGAVGPSLLAEDLAELVGGDGEGADLVALAVAAGGGVGGEGGLGEAAVDVDEAVLELFGSAPVPLGAG
jgi:hypothetical protein